MKAAIYQNFGPPEVLKIVDLPTPVPADHEVLIKIRATTVAKEDPDSRKAPGINGLFKPKNPILGMYLAGTVEAAGKSVSRFQVGDQVYGSAGVKGGASAEYICLPENAALIRKPDGLTFQQAAAVPNGAITTIPFLVHLAKIKAGDKVLLTGASGTVGTSAIQLCKYYGAEVTGVCSTQKIGLVQSLGADHVIDYTQEDFTENGRIYDIIFDTVGSSSFSRCKGSLTPQGVYLTTVPTLEIVTNWLNPFNKSKQSLKFAATALQATAKKTLDLGIINQIIEEGKYLPVIDKEFALEEIVQAHIYVEGGHKVGDVVINIE